MFRALIRPMCTIVLAGASLSAHLLNAQSGLQVTYGSKGVQTVNYNGVTLEDVGAYPSDQFHIWHMKSTDLSGNVLSQGQYGWGENNSGTSWDPQSLTETYTFSWGTIATQFLQNGNNLDLVVTEVNRSDSGIVFDGAQVFPFSFHFPQMPVGFYGYNQYTNITTEPGVTPADYGLGIVTSVVPDESLPIYGGWLNQGGTTYVPLMTATAPDSLPTYYTFNDVPVQPGNSYTYRISLRFTPEGTPADSSDAYRSFAQTYPNQLNWPDRRIIGSAYVAEGSGSQDPVNPSGFPTNPRRYLNDPAINIYSAQGLQSFQQRMLQQATQTVTTTAQLNSQGVITWNIEGETWATSYVCSPDQISTVAPEMESVVNVPGSPYNGMHLVDAYFKTITSSGARAGVCIRPSVFAENAAGQASQTYLTANSDVIANLENKARYAYNRWGTTLFYIDSAVNANGGAFDPAILQQISHDMPNVLFIPEEFVTRDYAYAAPFYSFLYHTTIGTPATVLNAYPTGFGVNLINDVSASTLAQYTPQLIQQVAQGDVLMGVGQYWQANDPTLTSIYAAAGQSAPAAPVTASVNWGTPAPIVYGQPLSLAQLNATSNVAGTFVYSPAAGTVLNTGTYTLLATFVPTNASQYKTVTATTSISVSSQDPILHWDTPAPMPSGTPLSAAQLNPTSNLPGYFTFEPGAGTVLTPGTYYVRATFVPANPQDYNTRNVSTYVTVTNAVAAKRTP